VQDHAGGIDQRPQRVAERLAKLSDHSSSQPFQRYAQAFLIQSLIGNFLTEACEHGADAVRHRRMPFVPNQFSNFRLAQQLAG
jgi:hypothetical protein